MIGAFALIVVVVALTSGGGGSKNPAPKHFRATNRDIVLEVRHAIDGASSSPGLASPIVHSDCEHDSAANSDSEVAGLNCFIAYTVKEPTGISNDLELVEPSRPIFKALFRVQGVQVVSIQVKGPTTSIGGKQGNSPLFDLECTRRDSNQIDWDHVDGPGMRSICNYTQIAKGS